MSLDPLLDAAPAIQIHAAAAIAAFALGAWVLFRRKGDTSHKRLGKVWVALMVVVAVSSLFVWQLRTFGLFSPIHVLSLITLLALWQGVRQARARNIKLHRRTMQLTYVGALLITGFFTFLPGRIMNQVVFGPDGADPAESWVFFAAVALVLGAFVVLSRWRPGKRRQARVA